MKNKGVWIVLIIVAIIVVVIIVKNKNSANKPINNPVQNLIQNSGLGNVISSGGAVTTTNTPPVIKTSGYNIGDKIYSKATTNIYKTANASSTNLDTYKSFSQGELIGTYLATDGLFTKILIASPAHTVFALSNQIYSK